MKGSYRVPPAMTHPRSTGQDEKEGMLGRAGRENGILVSSAPPPLCPFLHPQLQVCARSCEVPLCDSTWGNREEAQPSLLLLEAGVRRRGEQREADQQGRPCHAPSASRLSSW